MGAGFMMLQGVAYPPLPSPLEGEMPGRAEGGITCSKATIAC